MAFTKTSAPRLQSAVFMFVCLAAALVGAQEQQRSLRQGGAADLDAWSRDMAGAAGQFTNPNTSDWIAYRPQAEDVTAGGILDASAYVERPSGKHGFLKQDGKGNFVFEDGTPVRFLGGQINAFPRKEDAEYVVQWMRRHGLTYARAHGFGLPREERWDRLDYLLYQCKQAGIYLVLTPVYWTEFEVEDPEGNMVETSSHIILFFNDNVEQAVRELWKEFYTHENPYTGLRYADDPTLMAFEFKNEDSAFWALDWIKSDLPQYWAEIRQQYSAFLKDKYGSTEALRAAWTLEGYPSALHDGESLEAGNIEIYEMASWDIERDDRDIGMRPRKSDQTEFLHKKQSEFYARSEKYLREELGCKQAICGSNWRGHSYSMRFVLETDSKLDYIDQHDYFDHPQGGWNTRDAVQHNESMLKSPEGGLVGNLAPRQVMNRPYTVSEWNIGSWNEHLMEASFSMVANGMAQGWDGLLQFVLLPRRAPGDAPTLPDSFFSVSVNPSVVLQYPTLARMWHRKDIAEAEPVFIRRISPEEMYIPGPIPTKFTPAAFMVTHARPSAPKEGEYGHLLSVVGKVGNEFVPEPKPHFEAEGIDRYFDPEAKVARSMNGELTWDWGQGYMVIDTPRTQAICGYVGGLEIATEDVAFASSTAYGSVFVTTLEDDKPLRESGHLLVTALGRARNTGTVYGNAADRSETTDRHASDVRLPPEQRVAVFEVGEAPIISEPIRGTLTLALAEPEMAAVYALDDVGRRGERILAEVNDGKLEVKLPGGYGVRLMEIVFE